MPSLPVPDRPNRPQHPPTSAKRGKNGRFLWTVVWTVIAGAGKTVHRNRPPNPQKSLRVDGLDGQKQGERALEKKQIHPSTNLYLRLNRYPKVSRRVRPPPSSSWIRGRPALTTATTESKAELWPKREKV